MPQTHKENKRGKSKKDNVNHKLELRQNPTHNNIIRKHQEAESWESMGLVRPKLPDNSRFTILAGPGMAVNKYLFDVATII